MNRAPRAGTAARPLVAVLALVLTLGFAAGCGGAGHSAAPHSSPAPTAEPAAGPAGAAATSVPATAGTLARSEPVGIEIPRIGVRAPVGRVGLTPQGTVDVPPLSRPGEAGWYVNGPTPGEIGPAVILGHVDSKTGPAVFFRLPQLRTGDEILVARADGTTARFHITAMEQVLKARFPTDRVYGDLDHAGLRLVTCGGSFDRGEGSYRDNVIVYADLDPLTPR